MTVELPRPLAPWRPWLAIFPRDLALSLGPVLQRLSFAVGPLRMERADGEGDPDGLVLPCEDRDAEVRSWFVYAIRVPKSADRDAIVADLDQRGVEAKAYMPAIHLMEHYRERFGFRAGQFPVAEDASERLLALPFHPAISEAEVDRVCEALAEAMRGEWL